MPELALDEIRVGKRLGKRLRRGAIRAFETDETLRETVDWELGERFAGFLGDACGVGLDVDGVGVGVGVDVFGAFDGGIDSVCGSLGRGGSSGGVL